MLLRVFKTDISINLLIHLFLILTKPLKFSLFCNIEPTPEVWQPILEVPVICTIYDKPSKNIKFGLRLKLELLLVFIINTLLYSYFLICSLIF